MSDLAVSWVAVAPSAWQRGLRCFGLALAAGVAGGTALMRLTGSGALAALGAAGSALLAARLGWTHARGPDKRAWSVAPDGRVRVRDGAEMADGRDAAVIFASPAFVVLGAGRRSLEIWRDATPIPAFRRLSVAARWRVQRRR